MARSTRLVVPGLPHHVACAPAERDLRPRMRKGWGGITGLSRNCGISTESNKCTVTVMAGKDWETDLTAAPDKLILPHHRDHVWVHRGFLEAFEGQRREILKAVDGLPPNVGLYITGHSLGGAMAQIASAFLERDTLAACYTYGAPRVGEALFDAIVKCPHYRIVHKMDLVPATPPPEYNGYVHTGDPRLILDGVDFALRRSRDPLAEAVAIL